MRDSSFPEERIDAGGQRVIAARIECSCCGAVGYYPRKRGAARRPPDAIATHFRKQGWNLKGAKVRCPECARRRPRGEEKGKSMVKTVQKRVPAVAFGVSVEPASKTESVELLRPVASLEDKQVINMKLMEVYDNPDVGYKPGWSDAVVARDLGVRKDWVADVRELMFGPHGSNAALDAFFEGVAEIQKRAVDMQAEQAEACRAVAAVRSQIDTIDRDLRAKYAEDRDFAASILKLGEAIKAELGR